MFGTTISAQTIHVQAKPSLGEALTLTLKMCLPPMVYAAGMR